MIIFRDIVGKLDVLRVECDKCGRRGSYPLDRLIERYGIDAKLFDWEPEADCPRKAARNEHAHGVQICRRSWNGPWRRNVMTRCSGRQTRTPVTLAFE